MSYHEIAAASGYSSDYIKDVGSKLWRRLSQALGIQVTKSNLHSVIKRYARQEVDQLDRSIAPRFSSEPCPKMNFEI
ncbi:hypothetical protein IQ264_20315 [Phormidium sp. LEGE 05292]|uniref:hypothetical protein n=1 Tax=[Phormidium] sp. LEGE 05292 TaxID=767427 RepID=UPI001880CD7B|nr:hypothetical protein [Phormidium sp. LEGE 05292]MBE9227773.1 hypothetical protein [Phormidium sp. LEGE 05292]